MYTTVLNDLLDLMFFVLNLNALLFFSLILAYR
jgi:hypothetical protein